MELTKCMETRRSIRSYKEATITMEQLEEMISAANLAPSWKNSQVSRYYATINPEKIKEFDCCMVDLNREKIKNASGIIVSTVVKNRSGFERDGSFSTHLENGWQFFDNGLQIENLCLKATELGFGTLIMGYYDYDKTREFFQIPETEEIVALISLGVADQTPEMPPRKAVSDILTIVE